MKHKMNRLFLLLTVIGLVALISSCKEKSTFRFETANEAITACHKELNEVKNLKKANVKQLAEIISTWMELQDSTLSIMMKDSTIKDDMKLTCDFFDVTDSIKSEIERLAWTEKRSITDVVKLKIQISEKNYKIRNLQEYARACDFYQSLDTKPIYPELKTTLTKYNALLDSTKTFKKERELYHFIAQEDQCFRSMMTFLQDVTQDELETISIKTSKLIDVQYRNVSTDIENTVNKRVLMYLSMRSNRRILQNAQQCISDVKKEVYLDDKQLSNYRWMIVQPFIAIDDYSTALLTEEQKRDIMNMATSLSETLAKMEGKDYAQTTQEENMKLDEVLSKFILDSFLRYIF